MHCVQKCVHIQISFNGLLHILYTQLNLTLKMHICSSESCLQRHGSVSLHICLTVGLCLFDITGGFCATSTTGAYIFHAFPSCHLNCDEQWRSTGFSYTIKIKPLHVYAVREKLLDMWTALE